VLVFVGLKMLAEIIEFYLPVYVSLLVILGCIPLLSAIPCTRQVKKIYAL